MDSVTDAALRVAVAIIPGTKVLEICLRDGELAKALPRLSLDYTGCDLPASVRKLAATINTDGSSSSCTLVEVNAGKIPVESGAFMWVFVSEAHRVLELLGVSTSEIVRVLAPGGWIWLAFDSGSDLSSDTTRFHELGCADASTISWLNGERGGHRILRRVGEGVPD